ncbi:MAG TPA: glycosyltransferase [Candidatus Didemnitutus sp.]|nr:glycosyltransferase [Candidatus Didemnitutus sp.]
MPDSRPRMLYFNGPWDFLGERLRISYIDPFRRLLEQDFEVISVEGDRDFKREVEIHRPDVAFFHAGTESPLEREPNIRNTDAFPELPRGGFVFRDPMSPSRLASMNRLRAWGVQQVFSDFRTSDSPLPFFADSIYVPWWADDELFRDYGERKTIPITLAGSGWLSRHFYTWRYPIFVQLALRLPVYHVPAFETHQKHDAYVGESYARLLNRSLISAGCGSACRYLTLKLLEIPAARCCLLTEETEVMKALGFRDGENCIFADEKNVAAKVSAVLDNPGQLQAITDAGYHLVRTKHTQRNRRMIREWFDLWSQRGTGGRIVQTHPLEPLRVVHPGETAVSTFPTENPLLEKLQAGYRQLAERRWTDAIESFAAVLGCIPYVAEASLGTAMARLEMGEPAAALPLIEHIFTIQAKLCNYARPDPISLAYAAVAYLRLNQPDRAFETLARHPRVLHPALNALRWHIAQHWPKFRVRHPGWASDRDNETRNSETIHLLPPRPFAAWLEHWAAQAPAAAPAAVPA